MARGGVQEQNLANSQAAGYQGQANTAFNGAMPVIQQQLQNPGFDAKTSDAIRRSGMDTTNTAFDAAKFSAAQRAGSTGNEAMYYASADDLANKRAQGLSTAANTAEMEIGKQKVLSQQQAIQDASQLYNFGTGAATDMYGIGQRAQASRTDPLKVGWSAKDGLSVGN